MLGTLCYTLSIAQPFPLTSNSTENETLNIKLSYKTDRLISGNVKQPVALIGVYKKFINNKDTIQDIHQSIAYLKFPQMDTLAFKTHSYKGFKILNLSNDVYKTDTQFWEQYNLPWLEYLTNNKTTIYVLSDSAIDQLKYQFSDLYPFGPFVFRYFNATKQLIRTGFGKEIEYLDGLIKKGTYTWNEQLGAYEANTQTIQSTSNTALKK